ncbi:MAG: NADH-quinone oxidoreductase subunit N, partial [Proteobacteria bacterium]|nr:NADH-quinone oxidoreductase subunit N [Pseudomonadota bacterium]
MDWNTSLQATMPELVLSIGALALMLVAAWGGQRAMRMISWTAVAVLLGAGISLAGPASYAGAVFDGLYRADAFAAFAKMLIYIAAAVSIVVAPRFFETTDGDALHPEYPVLILLATAGMGMMVSAGDMLTLYVGL